jgi:zinc protease
LLFQKHPYGTQSTIGKGEHLKNPSMLKIHDYFNTYYVPNNMAIILVGDLDFDKTIAQIDRYFGQMEAKPVPAFTFTPESPIASPLQKKIYGPQSEATIFGFRLNGVDSEDALYLQLLDYMLNNSAAGLMDLNLIQKQKVLAAGCGSSIDKDYSVLYFYGIPKEGQTLDEVRTLILEQLENIKKGNFDSKLVEACKKNMKLDREKGLENNQWRSGEMIDAFIFDRPWKVVLEDHIKINALTSDELKAFVIKKLLK